MIPSRESMTVEFKSDRKKLSDRELIETVVCLANSEGGELWLGVEDDGTPTGLHADHAELATLPAFIAGRTAPRLDVRVTPVEAEGVRITRMRAFPAPRDPQPAVPVRGHGPHDPAGGGCHAGGSGSAGAGTPVPDHRAPGRVTSSKTSWARP